ncbi:uncharacterized protein LOC106630265 [Zonotrichia albicollis]|uniref:uncharacterized protein LOC106630265 n=1 Tax=Zonotrichia albicollis TaxID=44394 RepID=UPI003D80FD87
MSWRCGPGSVSPCLCRARRIQQRWKLQEQLSACSALGPASPARSGGSGHIPVLGQSRCSARESFIPLLRLPGAEGTVLAPSAGTKRRILPAPGPRLLGAALCAGSRSVCPGREPQRPCRRSVCPGSEAPGQGIMGGTMVSSPGLLLLLLAPRQADSEPQEESESCSIPAVANEPRHLQEGPAAAVPHLAGAQEASWHQQGDATCERAVSADVENGFCSSDGSVREPLAPQGTAATGNEHKRIIRRFLCERFRCHPVGTAVLILLLLVLVLALVVALAVQAAPQVPVTSVTLLLVLGCPHGYVGCNGVCYYFSRNFSTWEQGQERCSALQASLAIAKDEEAMDLLFRLRGNGDFWLGLRRRDERLHWVDGSSYSSRVPVFGNSECVYLADERFKSGNCSNERPYVYSKAQAPL